MKLRLRSGLQSVLLASAVSAVLACAAGAAPAESGKEAKQALAIAHGSDCFSCHAVDHKIVGPAFDAVARKYAGKPGAENMLVMAVKKGHVGTWGNVPMPPHPQLTDAQIRQVVAWILSLKPQKPSAQQEAAKTYTYKVDGKSVETHFPIFKPGTHKVTADIFRGYELYNSYCFRCHGEDATGSEYAPDLRRSLDNGMTKQQFVTIAMEGRKAKGMPSWAGFFSPHEIDVIYQYVKARALKVVAVGRPPE
jgi:cytochrome c